MENKTRHNDANNEKIRILIIKTYTTDTVVEIYKAKK